MDDMFIFLLSPTKTDEFYYEITEELLIQITDTFKNLDFSSSKAFLLFLKKKNVQIPFNFAAKMFNLNLLEYYYYLFFLKEIK